MVDGDSGIGLDPQVASSPLEPTIVTRHYLAFPQHWQETGGRWKERCVQQVERRRTEKEPVIGLAVQDGGSRGRLQLQD